jgi:ABC-type sugar transport system ATPase subunit
MKNLKQPWFTVTHDQNEAMTFADNIIVMSEGEVRSSWELQKNFLKDRTLLLLDIL